MKNPLRSAPHCEVNDCFAAEMDRLTRLFRNIANQIGEMTDVDWSDAHAEERRRLLFLRAGAHACIREWHAIAERLARHRVEHGC